MLTLIEKIKTPQSIHDQLALTAAERQRSFYRCKTQNRIDVKINLKRGTVLKGGDILCTDEDDQGRRTYVLIIAKPEPVITVTAAQGLDLLKAAYHLGNRHIGLEVQSDYLRLSPDSVLEQMLQTMPVTMTSEIVPFHPETGAYHHHE